MPHNIDYGTYSDFLANQERGRNLQSIEDVGRFRIFEGPSGQQWYYDDGGHPHVVDDSPAGQQLIGHLQIQSQQTAQAQAETERLRLLLGGAEESAEAQLRQRRKDETALRRQTTNMLQSLGPVLLEAPR